MQANDLTPEPTLVTPTSLSVPRVLALYVKKNQINFTLEGNPLPPELVYSPEMVMPIICIEAMRLWQSMERPANSVMPFERPADESLGVTFVESRKSFFPLSAHPPVLDQSITSTLRLLCFNLANRRVFSLKENTPVELAPFIEAWAGIDWYQDTISDIPVPKEFNARFFHEEFVERLPSTPKPQIMSPFASKNELDPSGL